MWPRIPIKVKAHSCFHCAFVGIKMLHLQQGQRESHTPLMKINSCSTLFIAAAWAFLIPAWKHLQVHFLGL